MLNKIFQKAMGFLQQPSKAFDGEKKTEVMEAFVYMAVLSVIVAVLSGLMSLFSALPGVVITLIVVSYITGIVASVIMGLWLHLWSYIFGAKKGLNQTLKTVFYSGTPNYLLGWIPVINILFLLWTLYLNWVGLQRLQGMPGNRAAMTIVIAFVIPMIVVAALVLVGLAMFAAYGGLSQGNMFPQGFELPQ